jgi:hypothetical protein
VPALGAAVLALLLALAAPSTAGGRVVLVGMDGASWNVIDPLLARGELPHFAALIARGRSAELETVEPVSSPVVWTSLATGRSPAAHGVTDFFATRLRVAVPTVFERLARSGLRVGLYDYLVTWPPQSFPGGFVIPGWLRRDPATTPPDVWERAGTPPFVVDYRTPRTDADYLALSRRELAEKASRWNALVRAFDPEVGAVVFYSADARSHRFWRAAWPDAFDDELPPPDPALHDAIAEGYRGLDAALGGIVATLGGDDAVLVASDHGFRAREDGVRPVWVSHLSAALAEDGLDPGRRGFRVVSGFAVVAIRLAPGGSLAERDALLARLEAWLRSIRAGDGRPLYAVYGLDVAPRPAGHERPLLSRLYQWGLRQVLWHVYDTRPDPGAFAVIFALPQDGVLAELGPDAPVRVGERTHPLRELVTRQEFSGAHDPLGVFLAAGGPIAHSPSRGRLSVLEVAPLLFYLAGRPIPDDLERELPRAWIDPAALAARPPRRVAAAELPGLEAGGAAAAAPDGLTETLRALGYVE